MNTYGILLPCDGSEPMPISVGDHEHINELVGGHIDAVSRNFDPSLFEEGDVQNIMGDGSRPPFIAIGYVHDEGILLDLPVNPMASVMFEREIFGPCVVVSGTSPSGDYDGDNHDIPEWFANVVFQGGLHDLAERLSAQAQFQSEALLLAFKDGVFNADQFAKIVSMMSSEDPKYDDIIEHAIDIATVYAIGRKTGLLPKFDRLQFESFQQKLNLTDEDIEKFWEENI